MSKAILKLSESKAVVKVFGTDAEETITLGTDLLSTTQVAVDTEGNGPRVNLIAIHWTGSLNSTAVISRGADAVMHLQANAASSLMFQDQDFTDNVNNTEDIQVACTGDMQIYFVLRKASGYISKVEDSVYGSYDDPTRVGASTTLSGSPDRA